MSLILIGYTTAICTALVLHKLMIDNVPTTAHVTNTNAGFPCLLTVAYQVNASCPVTHFRTAQTSNAYTFHFQKHSFSLSLNACFVALGV